MISRIGINEHSRLFSKPNHPKENVIVNMQIMMMDDAVLHKFCFRSRKIQSVCEINTMIELSCHSRWIVISNFGWCGLEMSRLCSFIPIREIT